MYKNYLPDVLPDKWVLSELDEENCYVEFLGFNGEFLISVMEHPGEHPEPPYFLCLNQMKGILGRYDFDSLDQKEWFSTAKEAVESALALMEWMSRNYPDFMPLTLYVYVSLGTEDELQKILRHFVDRVTVNEFQGQSLVFREVKLTWGATSYTEAALRAIKLYYQLQRFPTKNMVVGYLTNEKFELIEDLRPAVLEAISQKRQLFNL